MTHLILGNGEVGKALQVILGCEVTDIMVAVDQEQYDVLHIAFPCRDKEDFIKAVREYQDRFDPELTIIHSTVPVGTSYELDAVHSPVRGIHPNLEEGIRTFTKYFGGKHSADAAKIFQEKGITCVTTEDSRDTEALKLLDTLQYGLNIMIQKEIYKFCVENDVDFHLAYKHANKTYNEGYTKLGKPEVVRPYLDQVKGGIGGHCVIPNAELLEMWIADELLIRNEIYKMDDFVTEVEPGAKCKNCQKRYTV